MDGVVVNSVAHKRAHWERVLRDEFDLTTVETANLVGLNVHDKYEFLVERHGLAADRDAFVRALEADVERVYTQQVDLLSGLEETLDWLADRSVRVGLASAATRPKVELVVDRFGLGERLDAIVSADDVTGESKPDPAIYQHAVSLLSAEPDACLAVEDSPHGVTAATTAGLYCLGYNPPGSPDRDVDHADEVVSSPSDLHARLRSLVVSAD